MSEELNNKQTSELRKVSKNILVGIITAIVTALASYFLNKSGTITFSVDGLSIKSIIESLSAFYQQYSIPMRFNVFIWLMSFFLYFILERYDKRSLLINEKRNVKKTNLRQYFFTLYALFAFMGLLFVNRFIIIVTDPYIDLALDTSGLLLTLLGFIILIFGRQEIDGLWGPHLYTYNDKKFDKLITSGAYRYTRHPIYLGQIVLASSSLLLSRSLFFVIFFVIVLTNSRQRANNEENHLREVFGAKYLEYCKKVKKWWLLN